VTITVSFEKLDTVIAQKEARLRELEEVLRTKAQINELGLSQKADAAAREKSL
jgi:hypothetical protein